MLILNISYHKFSTCPRGSHLLSNSVALAHTLEVGEASRPQAERQACVEKAVWIQRDLKSPLYQ